MKDIEFQGSEALMCGMIAMVVIFEITGTRFLTLKAGHSIFKEKNMKEPCSIMESNNCAQEKHTNVHMTVCMYIYVFSCIYMFSLRLSAQQ